MERYFTVWENDMVEDIDKKVVTFMDNNFHGYGLKQLSALPATLLVDGAVRTIGVEEQIESGIIKLEIDGQ